jgi:uncharacterized protein YlaI
MTSKKCSKNRKLDGPIKTYNCEKCKKSFTQKVTLVNHGKICKVDQPVEEKDNELKNQFSVIYEGFVFKIESLIIENIDTKDDYERLLCLEREKNYVLENKIKEMSLIEENLRLKIQIFELKNDSDVIVVPMNSDHEKSKTQYLKSKLKNMVLNDIPILTIEYASEFIQNHYTFLIYRGDYSQLITFLVSMFSRETSTGTLWNYVCSKDSHRTTFYRLIEKNPNKWVKDKDATFIHDILDVMEPLLIEYFKIFNSARLRLEKLSLKMNSGVVLDTRTVEEKAIDEMLPPEIINRSIPSLRGQQTRDKFHKKIVAGLKDKILKNDILSAEYKLI